MGGRGGEPMRDEENPGEKLIAGGWEMGEEGMKREAS